MDNKSKIFDTEVLVSIITPSYNSEKTLMETFESIKKQTFSNWEWLIIDDHSSDSSFDMAKKLALNDKRIIALQTKANSGAAAARNLGIEQAKGRYIAFLDSDDMWKPTKLEDQIKYMVETGASFVYSDYDILFPDGKIKTFSPKASKATYKLLLKKCDIGCLTAMYDSQTLGKKFMPLDTPKREDYATWLDITRSGIVAYRVPKNLAIYRIQSSSVSHNKWKLPKFHFNVYKKHEKFNFFKSLYYLFIHSFNKVFNKY